MLKGILFSLSANILFGAGYYFAVLLRPLESDSIFGFRIVVLMPFILLAIFLFHQQKAFKDLYYRVKQTPYLIFILLLLALNTAIQLWLFLWAPNNNQAIEVSIGYLLLPIVAVALGKLVFKEHFTLLKWLALFFATLGVTINIVLTASISWATFVAGFGYPIYIVLRRYFHINNLATFFVELLLLLPFAIYYIAQVDQASILTQNEYLYFYLALLGLVNGMAFILYIASSNLLPINVLGLIGYAEPLVMLFISFAIGEVLEAKSYILMACLAVSIILLSVDSFRKVKP
ncbi:EamA family transporter RarD [Glaesserella parasuis]|uniref:EamA family transporter RarD n=1 Tax=Glaesserella parasuis TaxID=738 RepID=UPI0021BD2F3B|nr:EamA family transporter RarD [Glaesserella parasuis]MCT8557363.1 EamA family transporter RarD [Glaesserella parasuis]MCT8741504.1 EamA family transporter RarD [Glaesserella parasuis]MCT8749344.1 EamA family transporter RarD [Glaesserella parasuis]MCT8762003.1 EamA family transporter RarD [Glaesserella parasuis]MCT8779054.1 EamA family transporter RarD [Glaesserella parasuis]